MKTSKAGQCAVALALLSGVMASCADPNPPDVRGLVRSGPPRISWEEFKASLALDPQSGKYIVDGDIALTSEGELRAYYEQYLAQPLANALTVAQVMNGAYAVDDLWPPNNHFGLSYCVNAAGFGTRYANVVSALESAGNSWAQRVGVGFQHVAGEDAQCSASNANVVFDVQEVNGGSYFASSFFPSSARSDRTLFIDTSAFTTTSGGRTLEGILRHELGHVLGFRHEHIWLTPACTSEGTANAREVTPYDVDSVMHYPQCRASSTGGYAQTELDYSGAISLYGLAPALLPAIWSPIL